MKRILSIAGLAALVSCDQKPAIQQMITQAQRAESLEINKVSQDLSAKIQALEGNIQKLAGAADDPVSKAKIAEVIGQEVGKVAEEKMKPALTAINDKLDALDKALKEIKEMKAAAAAAPAPAPAPTPVTQAPASTPPPQQFTPPPQQQPSSGNSGIRVSGQGQSDPNRKRFRFDF